MRTTLKSSITELLYICCKTDTGRHIVDNNCWIFSTLTLPYWEVIMDRKMLYHIKIKLQIYENHKLL